MCFHQSPHISKPFPSGACWAMLITESGAYPIRIVNKALLKWTSFAVNVACSMGVVEASGLVKQTWVSRIDCRTPSYNTYFHLSQLSRFPSNTGGFGMFLGPQGLGPQHWHCLLLVRAALNSLRVVVNTALCCSYACSALCSA